MQARLGIDQFRLLIRERDLGAADIERADEACLQSLLLRLEFFFVNADRLFAHPDFRAIQKHVVIRRPHIHRNAVHECLIFERALFLVQPRDRELARNRAAGVDVLDDAQRSFVIVGTQP